MDTNRSTVLKLIYAYKRPVCVFYFISFLGLGMPCVDAHKHNLYGEYIAFWK